MPINEYDEILAPVGDQPSVPQNQYDSVIADGHEQQKQTLKGSMFVASQTQPDRAAKVQELSKRTNLPAAIVDRNYDTIAKSDPLAETDYDGIITKSPGLAKFLEAPENASVAHDDLPNLTRTEQTVQDHGTMSTMYAALNSGVASAFASAARIPALGEDLLHLPGNLVSKAIGHPEDQVRSSDWLRNNPVATFYDKQAQAFHTSEQDISPTKELNIESAFRRAKDLDISGAMQEISKGDYRRAAMGLAAQFVSNSPQQAAIIAGTMAGFGVPALVGAGVITAADANKKSQESGVDPATATANALAHGTIESAFEKLGTFGVLKQWEGLIAKQWGKQVSKEIFQDFAKTIAYSMASEGNEELLTSAAQDMSDYITGVNPDALTNLGQRALDAGFVGAASGGGMTAPSAIGSGLARGAKMRESTLAKDFYLAFGSTAEASKLRQRLPEAQRAFVDQVTKDGPVENVLISPDAIVAYFQSQKMNPTAAMQEIGALKEFTDAQETGTDVKIPLAQWAEKVVGTPHFAALADDVKFNPTALSVNEAKLENEKLKAETEKQAKEAEAAAAAEAPVEKPASIGQQVTDQLKAAGVDDSQAATYSKIYESTFNTLGQRTGQDPQKLFESFGLKINGPEQQQPQAAGETALNQDQKPPAPAFYSKLTQTVDQKMGGSASVDQVKGMLREIKPEEVKWSGLDDFLKGKEKVSKPELLEFLKANQLDVKEVTKRDAVITPAIEADLQRLSKEADDLERKYEASQTPITRERNALVDKAFDKLKNTDRALALVKQIGTAKSGPDMDSAIAKFKEETKVSPTKYVNAVLKSREAYETFQTARAAFHKFDEEQGYKSKTSKFSKYVLPGGETYREVLFTLPGNEPAFPSAQSKAFQDWALKTYGDKFLDMTDAEVNSAGSAFIAQQRVQRNADAYRSQHWDESNVLAHVRLNDRVDSDGKKVLFVEEIQSDWHQEGRKRGYKGNQDAVNEWENLSGKMARGEASAQDEARWNELGAANPPHTGVPDAPFRKTWHEFAFKRILRMAAEGGYDRVAWTTGEQQAERYDLSKQIESIEHIKNDDGTYSLDVKGIEDGEGLGDSDARYTESQLEGVVGKEIAQKIINGEGKKYRGHDGKMLEGLDLKVGGEGMKGFYDKILVDFANKFTKKFGGKVGETKLEVKNDPEVDEARYSVHSLDITPELRDAALNEGFSLFQGGDDPRGRIRFGKDAINIDLLKNADPSTFIHETGHFYLEVMGTLAAKEDAPEQIKADFQSILDWLGVKSREEIGVSQHEQWARGFEAYLMEGKAPTDALRQAFARFKVWLISVYRNIRALNVTLTDDVRSVMDRMMATDEQIAAAEAEQNFQPLFKDPEAFGMTGKKAESYKKAISDARIAAEETVNKKLMDDYERQRSGWWQEQRKAVRPEFEAQANNLRVYQALAGLQKGTRADGTPLPPGDAIKLSKKAIIERYGGVERVEKLPKPYVYTPKADGIHPEIAAELFGYASGEELLKALETSIPKEEFIDQQVEARLKEMYPDLLESEDFPEEAMKAVHNPSRSQMLRMELEHLVSEHLPVLKDVIRKVARRVPTEKAVREQATRIIGALTVRDIRPAIYQRAEAKSAKEAGEFLARGDFDKAFEAKRRELLNHELYLAAQAAKETVGKSVREFKRLFQKDEKLAKQRDMNLVNTARAVLAQFGLGVTDKKASEYLAPIESYSPEDFQTAISLVSSATERVGPYETIAYDDFVAMRDAVDAMWSLAKSSKEIEIDGRKVQMDEVKKELSNTLAPMIDGSGNKVGYNRDATKWDQVKMGLLGIKAALRRVEQWVTSVDGGDKGAFRTYIWNPVSEATAKYRVERIAYIQKFRDLVKELEPNLTNEPITAPELNYEFSNKQTLIGALLHTGNDSNRQKLLLGRGWAVADLEGTIDTSAWDAFLARMHKEGILTKADYDFCQSVWDLLEELKPQAQKVHKDLYGHYFNEVTANELVTPFGAYRGGYVPAVADPFVAQDAAIRADKEALEKSNNSFMFPTAGRGFTKKRVDAYSAPLLLDVRFVGGHIDKVLRFVHIEPAAKAVGRLVMDKKFRKTLDAFDPAVASDMLVPWLQRSAQQKVAHPGQDKWGRASAAFWGEVRRRTGLNAMVGNVTNALQQFTGLSIASVKVKPRHLRDALWQYTTSAKQTVKTISEKSEFMRTRVTSQAAEMQKEIDDVLLNPTKYEKARDFATKHGYILQTAAQSPVDVITWMGAYNEACENNLDEKEAVRSADSAVRSTQGTMAPEDISRFETGTPFVRTFTMFYSYFNMQANLLGTEFAVNMRKQGLKKGAGRALYIYTLGFMIPAVLSELIVKSLSGKGLDEDDDGEYIDDIMGLFFGSQFRTATAFFPIAGPALTATVNQFNNKWYDDKISTSPAVAMIESTLAAPKSVYEAITGDGSKNKKAIRDSLTAIGMLTGVPVAPLARPLGYLSDVDQGKARPENPIDFARGLVTGKSGKP